MLQADDLVKSGTPPPHKGLNSKVAVIGYLCICSSALLFDYLFLITGTRNYRALAREDYWIENLTTGFFLLASLLLFATTLLERSFLRRCIYALGAIAMVFIAGEEISWGQRILGFTTPDFLLNLNIQHELNLHNIEGKIHERQFLRYGSIMLFTVTSAAFFCQRYTLFRIPLPSMLLMFGFLVGLAYTGSIYSLYMGTIYVVSSLLLLFVVYTLLSRQVQWLVAAVASLILILTLLYVDRLNPMPFGNARREIQEYLVGVACLFYALEIWLAQRRSRSIRTVPADIPNVDPVGVSRVPPWLAVCSFVMVCSVGLIALQFFKAKAVAADVEEIYQSIVSGKYGEPTVRSTFDVYLVEGQLIYFKEPCGRGDIKKRFFLHLVPADENNLPDDRKQYGFDSLDFIFGFYNPSLRFDGKCITRVPLPDYTIDRIYTGQSIRGKRLWTAEFSLP